MKLLKSNVALYVLLALVFSVVSVKQNLAAKVLSEYTKRHKEFTDRLSKVTTAKAIKGKSLEEKHLNMVKAGMLHSVRFDASKLAPKKWYKTLEKLGATPLRTLPSVNAVVVYAEADVAKKIEKLTSVRSVNPDRQIFMHSALPGCGDNIVGDVVCDGIRDLPNLVKDGGEMHWNIPATNAPKVWDKATGCGVKVCVIDSGIDMKHPDLQLRNKGGLNLVTGDVCGPKEGEEKNQLPDEENICDSLGHGTHVSGIIGGTLNGLGVIGMAPGAEIYSARVFGSYGSGSYSTITEGVAYCNEIGADVINMSLGGPFSDPSLEEEIQKALNRGAVVVASAGNSGRNMDVTDNVGYPAKQPGVLAVAASDENNKFAEFSSEGPAVGIIAPGTTSFTFDTDPNMDGYQYYDKGIFSTLAGNYLDEYYSPIYEEDEGRDYLGDERRFGRLSGTSMAAPHVAGAVALLKSLHPDKSGAVMVKALKLGAKDVGLADDRQGAGLLDVEGALDALDSGRADFAQTPNAGKTQ